MTGYDEAMDGESEKSEAVEAFACAARDYCEFIDSLELCQPDQIFARLEILLATLHFRIVRLPITGSVEGDWDEHHLTHEDWKAVAGRISDAIGEECWAMADYLASLGGSDEETEDVSRVRHAWDDFADIYRDLQVGLRIWDVGTPDARDQACWEWGFGYHSHWGAHLMRAAMTMHQVLGMRWR